MDQNQQVKTVKAIGIAWAVMIIGMIWLCGGCFGLHVGPFGQTPSVSQNVDTKRGAKPEESMVDALTPEVNQYLRQTLKDYGSLEIVDCSPVVTWLEDRWAQRVKYRARNSFGAMELSQVIFIIKDGKVTGTTSLD